MNSLLTHSSSSKQRKLLSFPPLVTKWTVKSEASWPGAEYTRRTRLRTHCTEEYSEDFLHELKETLGTDNFEEYETAMRPVANRILARGRPPCESGRRPIQAPWRLKRADDMTDDHQTMASTTHSLSGLVSKTRQPDFSYTGHGPVPVYMFEDRERMDSLSQWFDKYGRPKPKKLTAGPRQPYTHWEARSKRCCGEPSQVQMQRKGFITM